MAANLATVSPLTLSTYRSGQISHCTISLFSTAAFHSAREIWSSRLVSTSLKTKSIPCVVNICRTGSSAGVMTASMVVLLGTERYFS